MLVLLLVLLLGVSPLTPAPEPTTTSTRSVSEGFPQPTLEPLQATSLRSCSYSYSYSYSVFPPSPPPPSRPPHQPEASARNPLDPPSSRSEPPLQDRARTLTRTPTRCFPAHPAPEPASTPTRSVSEGFPRPTLEPLRATFLRSCSYSYSYSYSVFPPSPPPPSRPPHQPEASARGSHNPPSSRSEPPF